MSLNIDTINNYSYISWHTNTGNFNGKCKTCPTKIKEGDTILIESDTSNGLVPNTYCIPCGNKRLQEFSDYYGNLRKNKEKDGEKSCPFCKAVCVYNSVTNCLEIIHKDNCFFELVHNTKKTQLYVSDLSFYIKRIIAWNNRGENLDLSNLQE